MRLTGVVSGGLFLGCEATLERVGPPSMLRDPDGGAPPDVGTPADAGSDTQTLDSASVDSATPDALPDAPTTDATMPDTSSPIDSGACPDPRVVTLHDTHAQALYFDGTYGPTTGVIRVEDIVAGAVMDMEFWHGHGGSTHRFTVQPADFEMLRRGERVTLVTSEVDGHSHMLFIDPVDGRWRVSGAPDQTVEVC